MGGGDHMFYTGNGGGITLRQQSLKRGLKGIASKLTANEGGGVG